jgi:hypothetical protein
MTLMNADKTRLNQAIDGRFWLTARVMWAMKSIR